MLAGKNMVKSRYHRKTYIFNPSFFSVPIEQMIKNETLKDGVRIAGSFMTAGIVTAMNIHGEETEEDLFNVLSERCLICLLMIHRT
ncbi:hypothetical protein HanIR_Chr15g0783761 [Helianthus annuus]|nr:hypothetical protein HanIR_Chr15g0783761 [Helianthus annuus]